MAWGQTYGGDFPDSAFIDDFAKKGHYVLKLNNDPEVCNHMLQMINSDLKHFGRAYDSHDRFISAHEEFTAIRWKSVRVRRREASHEYTAVDAAEFDINNDGKLDFVVRFEGMLSGMREDSLYILDSSQADPLDSLTMAEVFASRNQIALAGEGYRLEPPLEGGWLMWRLSPFIYQRRSYIYMQSLYKLDEATDADLVVIANYIRGTLGRKSTGLMNDVCYIKRTDAH